MKLLPTTVFAILLLAVCAPGAIDGAGSATQTGLAKENALSRQMRFPESQSLKHTGQAAVGDDEVDEMYEDKNRQSLYPQTWYQLLSGNKNESEEAKDTEEPKKKQREIQESWNALAELLRQMNPDDLREASTAHLDRLRAHRQTLSKVKVPEVMQRFLKDPQIRKDIIEMAVSLVGMSAASLLWRSPAVSLEAGLALYMTALMGMFSGAKDILVNVLNDDEVRGSFSKATATARSNIAKLLGRLNGEKAAEDVDAA